MAVFLQSLGCIVLSAVLFPSDAYAYLDPGTGSMMLQALAAGIIAAGVFWRRILNACKRFFTKK
jgi:hypothetical protein